MTEASWVITSPDPRLDRILGVALRQEVVTGLKSLDFRTRIATLSTGQQIPFTAALDHLRRPLHLVDLFYPCAEPEQQKISTGA